MPAGSAGIPLTHTLITGASAGLGLELARLFASAGEPLVLVARSEDRLAALADTLRRDHEVDVRVVPADLTLPGAAETLVRSLAAEGLGVRHLVNNAGFGAYGPVAGRDWSVYRSMIDLNVTALTALSRLLLEPMLAPGATGPRGIMNVASTAAFQPGPLMAVYFATKSYVLHFSEALAEEVRGAGVTVSAFCPGPTRTDFFRPDAMVPPEAYDAEGNLRPAALRAYERRDARRMDATVAARVGYAGYRAGKVVVIPGLFNRVQAAVASRLPRSWVRRLAHRAMRKPL
jgi:short-subunit dehydrogenase